MRTLGLEGIRRAKKLRTIIPNPNGKRAGDLLNRDFTAPAPNLVWVREVCKGAGYVLVSGSDRTRSVGVGREQGRGNGGPKVTLWRVTRMARHAHREGTLRRRAIGCGAPARAASRRQSPDPRL